MTSDELSALLRKKGERLRDEAARQRDELKAAKAGPWKPAVVVVAAPESPEQPPRRVVQIRRKG